LSEDILEHLVVINWLVFVIIHQDLSYTSQLSLLNPRLILNALRGILSVLH
jgi:hypothetical protein